MSAAHEPHVDSVLFSRKPIMIAVGGLIGVGKSTLTKRLVRIMPDFVPFYELGAGEERLKEFYGNKSKFALPLQYHLMDMRLGQIEEIMHLKCNSILDRSLLEDAAFVGTLVEQGHITKDQQAVYLRLLDRFFENHKKPDLFIFLDVSPDEAFRRIKLRNREYEVSSPSNAMTKEDIELLDYLKLLDKQYKKLVDELAEIMPVIIIDWMKFEENTQIVADTIKETIKQLKTPKKIVLKKTES